MAGRLTAVADDLTARRRSNTPPKTEPGTPTGDTAVSPEPTGVPDRVAVADIARHPLNPRGVVEEGVDDLAASITEVGVLQLVGILPCKVPSSGLIYQEALASVRDVFGDLVLPAVRQTRSVTEAHAKQVPVTARARWRAVADDYRAVVDELVSRGALPAGTQVRA
jgi:cellulose biosynthesis protein BcsQ